MRFCCNDLENSRMIGVVVKFLKNKFSFKLDLYFVRYMHANIKNKMQALKKNLIFDFFNEFLFDFSNKFLQIVYHDQSQKSHLFYKKKIAEFELGHQKKF